MNMTNRNGARTAVLLGAVVLVAQLAAAAEEPQLAKPHVSVADIAKLTAEGEAAAKAGKSVPNPARTLAAWGPYQGHLIYRTAPQAVVSVDDDYAEYYLILEGRGTMTIGGTLVDPKRTGPHSESPTVRGETAYSIAKGDMLMVPPATPHRISRIEGARIVYMSMHLPLQPKVSAAAQVTPAR